MRVFRDAFAIFRMEATLFTRFPKLKVSAIGVMSVLRVMLWIRFELGKKKPPGGSALAAFSRSGLGLAERLRQRLRVAEKVIKGGKKAVHGFVPEAD